MNGQALRTLADNAKLWARAYVNVTKALQVEGVEEDRARGEARAAANFAAIIPEDVAQECGPACPLCGRPEE